MVASWEEFRRRINPFGGGGPVAPTPDLMAVAAGLSALAQPPDPRLIAQQQAQQAQNQAILAAVLAQQQAQQTATQEARRKQAKHNEAVQKERDRLQQAERERQAAIANAAKTQGQPAGLAPRLSAQEVAFIQQQQAQPQSGGGLQVGDWLGDALSFWRAGLGVPAQEGAAPPPAQPQAAAPEPPAEEAPGEIDEAQLAAWREAFPREILAQAVADQQALVAQLEQRTPRAQQPAETPTAATEEQFTEFQAQEEAILDELNAAQQTLRELQALNYALYDVKPDEGDTSLLRQGFNTVARGVGEFMRLYDLPRQYVGRPAAALIFAFAMQNPSIGPALAAAYGTTPQEVQRILDEAGPNALWEQIIASLPDRQGVGPVGEIAYHAATDLVTDPLSYIGGAAAATRGAGAIGEALGLLNAAANLPGDAVIGLTRRGIGPIVERTGVTQLSEQGRRAVAREQLGDIAARIDQEGVTSAVQATGAGTVRTAPTQEVTRTSTGLQVVPAPQEAPPGVVPSEPPPPPPEPSGPAFRSLTPEQRAALREDPLRDITGVDTTTTPQQSVPAEPRETAFVTRPRYLNGESFSNEDFARFQEMVDGGMDELEAINVISADRQAAQAAQVQQVLPEPETPPAQEPSVPSVVQRIERPGVDPGTASKPQGLYTSPADVESPHAGLGGIRTTLRTNPDANVLTVKTGFVRTNRGNVGESAGIAALRVLVGEEATTRLLQLSKDEVVGIASREFPNVNWTRFTDAQEVLEGYAGMRARAAGYDAIWAIDSGAPAFNEYVGLTERAFLDAPTQDGTTFTMWKDPELPETHRIADVLSAQDPEWQDIPASLKRTESPDLAKYGLKKYNGKWYTAGQKAWRQQVREIEYLVDDVAPLRKDRFGTLPDDYLTSTQVRRQMPTESGKASFRDEWTTILMRRYVQEADEAAADRIFSVLQRKGQTIYVNPEGEVFVPYTVAGKRVLLGPDGEMHEWALRNQLKARSVGGLGNEPYVPELLDRLQAARTRYQAILNEPGEMVERGPGALGVIQSPTAYQGARVAESMFDKVRGYVRDVNAPRADRVGEPEPLLDLGDRSDWVATLARRGKLTSDEVRFLDTPVDLSKARNLGPDGSKIKRALAKEENVTYGRVMEAVRKVLDTRPLNEQQDVLFRLTDTAPAERGRIRRIWQTAGTAVRHGLMYNWPRAGYATMQDTLTDAFALMVDGSPGATRLTKDLTNDVLRQAARKGTTYVSPTMADVNRFYQALGTTIPTNVKSAMGGRYDEATGQLVEEGVTFWAQLGKRIAGKPGEVAGNIVAGSPVMRLRNGMDDIKRVSTYTDFYLRNVGAQRSAFFDLVRERAPRLGLDPDDAVARLERMGDEVFGVHLFSPDDVRRAFGNLNKGQAEFLARQWRERLGALEKASKAHMETYLFSYKPTKLDEAIGPVWMFHYWMTRASVLHTRLALDHPWLGAAYIRAWEGMQRMAEEQEDLPQWARQFISLNAGPYGLLGLTSPAAFLVGLGVVLDFNGVLPEDPSVADILSVLPLHPFVQAASSVYVTDRMPDLFGWNPTRQFAKAAANYLGNVVGDRDRLVKDPVAEFTYDLQALARQLAPGAKPLAAPAPSQRDTQTVKFYAMRILQERGEFMDHNQAVTDYANQVLANIDAGLFSGEVEAEALEQFSKDMMAGHALRTILPIQTLYPGVTAEARALNRQGEEAERGDVVLDPASTPADPRFLDTSREMTDEERYGDLAVTLADAGSPVARDLQATLTQYQTLGTEFQRETYESYNAMIYQTGASLAEEWGGPGFVAADGSFHTWEEWGSTDSETRRLLMDRWVAMLGEDDEIETMRTLRDEFEAAHPEVAGFKRWQRAVGDLGTDEFLRRMAAAPAFMAWWNEQDVAPARRKIVLMTPAAYLAAQGHEPSLYDTNAISDLPTVDPARMNPLDALVPESQEGFGFAGQPAFDEMSTQAKVQAITTRMLEFEAKVREFDAQVKQISGGVSYEALPPTAKVMVDVQLARRGLSGSAPRPGGILADYLEWASVQQPGADTSVEAYVRWYEANVSRPAA